MWGMGVNVGVVGMNVGMWCECGGNLVNVEDVG
jgi:hypothetical protein